MMAGGAEGEASQTSAAAPLTNKRVEPQDLEPVTVSLVVSQQDAWLFEWTRRFAAHAQGEVSDEQVVGAMLAEAFGTRCGPSSSVPRLARSMSGNFTVYSRNAEMRQLQPTLEELCFADSI